MKKLIVALIALAGFSPLYAESVSASSYVQTGLIAQYDAIDNAGKGQHSDSPSVWKDLVGGRDLTFSGSPTFGADKVSINAEDQYFHNDSCSDFVDAITDGAFTLEIHYAANDNKGGRTLFSIGTDYYQSPQKRYLLCYAWSNNIYDGFQYRMSAGASSGCPAVALGKQHTATFVVNGNKAYVYHDGVLKCTMASGGVVTGNNIFTLGYWNGDSKGLNRWTLFGDYRSVRVYNTALTAEQIATNVEVDRQRFLCATYTYRSITIDNAEALIKKTTSSAELSFGADMLARATGTKDKLYIAYGSSNYRGGDITRYDHVQYVADVAVETTAGTYQIPAGFGTDYTRFRFFFKTPGTTPSSSAYVASASLLSQYDAIDNAGKGQHADSPKVWKDLVGNHDLTFTGSPSFGAKTVSINNNDQYFKNTECSDFVSAIDNGAFTLEIHYTATQISNGRTLFTLGIPDDWSKRYLGLVSYDGNLYRCTMFRDTKHLTGCPSVAAKTQHTVSVVVNGNTAYIYHDGVLKYQQAAGSTGAGNNTFTLGYFHSTSLVRYTLLGDFCSVRAYSKALTEEEILANKNVDDRRYGAQEGAGYFISFSPIVVSDGSTTTWMYDTTTKVLTTDSGWEFDTDGNASGLTLTALKKVGTTGTLDFSGIPAAGTPSIVAFGKDLFYNKDGGVLTKLILPDTITSIGKNAFRESKVQTVTPFLPADITLGANAFYGANNLTGDLVIKTKEKAILPYESGDIGLFQGTKITSADLSQSKITSIGKNCFRSCSNLGDVSLPKTLTSIGSAVFFESLSKLTNIVFRSYPKSGFSGDLFSDDESSYKRRIVYPAGNADWKKFIDDRAPSSTFVTWDNATKAQRKLYTASFGSKKPLPACSLLFLEGGSYSKTRFWMVPKSDVGFSIIISSRVAKVQSGKDPSSLTNRWYKGMIHSHSYWSDGRAFPEQGAEAYRKAGYHFYSLTDHNRFGANSSYWRTVCESEGSWPMNVYRPIFESYRKAFPDADIREEGGKTLVRIKTFEEVKAEFDEEGRFLVLPGMEITRTAGERQVHMNYVGIDKGLATAEAGGLIQAYGSTISEVIGKSFNEVKTLATEWGDEAHLFFVNHPQWRFWDVLPQDILDYPEIRYFEVCNNGSDIPLPANMPGTVFSCDRFWDVILAHRCRAKGALLYALASDDAHWYPDSGTPQAQYPFADGYIQVRAKELTSEALIKAMDRGDFYASCGVDLEEVKADSQTGQLTVSVPAKEGVSYTIRFVGTKNDFVEGVQGTVHFTGNSAQGIGARDYPLYSETIGVTFKTVEGKAGERVEASYQLKDDDLYVRAVVESSEEVTGYVRTAVYQHVTHKTAWTQPLTRTPKQ